MYYNPIPLLEATADLRNLVKTRVLLIEAGLLTENVQALAGLDKSLDYLDKEVDKAILSAEKIIDVYTAISKNGKDLPPTFSKMFGASKPGDVAAIVAERISKMIPALKAIAKMDFSAEITGGSWAIGNMKRGIGDFLGMDSSEGKALSKLEAIAIELGEFSNLMIGAIATIARAFKYSKNENILDSNEALYRTFDKKEMKAMAKEVKKRTNQGLKSKMMGWLQNLNPVAEVSNLFGVSSGDIISAWFQCTPQLFTQIGPEMLKPLQSGSSNLTKALAQTTKSFGSFAKYAEKENITTFKPSMMSSADSAPSPIEKAAQEIQDELLDKKPDTGKIESALETADSEEERRELTRQLAASQEELSDLENERYAQNRDMAADTLSGDQQQIMNPRSSKKISTKSRKKFEKNLDKAILTIESVEEPVEESIDEALDLLDSYRNLKSIMEARRKKKRRKKRNKKKQKKVTKSKKTGSRKNKSGKAKKEKLDKSKKKDKSKSDKSKPEISDIAMTSDTSGTSETPDQSKAETKEKKKGTQTDADKKNIQKIKRTIRKQILKSIDKASKNPDKFMSDKKPGRIKKAAFKTKKYSYVNKKGKKKKTSARELARQAKISENLASFEDLLEENIVVENINSNAKEPTALERWLKIAGIDKKR